MPLSNPISSALVQLAVVNLGANAATISFSSIPGTYQTLQIVIQGRLTASVADDYFYIQFNGDTGANYDNQQLFADQGTASAAVQTGQTKARCGTMTGATGPTNGAGVNIMTIPFYANTTFTKTLRSSGAEKYSSVNFPLNEFAVRWNSTSAITSITFLLSSGNFLSGSRATLYGMT